MQNAFLLSEHKRFVQPDLHGKGLEINTLQKGFPSKKMQKMVLTPTHSNPVQWRMRVCIHNETKGAIEQDRENQRLRDDLQTKRDRNRNINRDRDRDGDGQNQRLRLDLQTTERERERERAKERAKETERERKKDGDLQTQTEIETETERQFGKI